MLFTCAVAYVYVPHPKTNIWFAPQSWWPGLFGCYWVVWKLALEYFRQLLSFRHFTRSCNFCRMVVWNLHARTFLPHGCLTDRHLENTFKVDQANFGWSLCWSVLPVGHFAAICTPLARRSTYQWSAIQNFASLFLLLYFLVCFVTMHFVFFIFLYWSICTLAGSSGAAPLTSGQLRSLQIDLASFYLHIRVHFFAQKRNHPHPHHNQPKLNELLIIYWGWVERSSRDKAA